MEPGALDSEAHPRPVKACTTTGPDSFNMAARWPRNCGSRRGFKAE